jgi:hypothetical protein
MFESLKRKKDCRTQSRLKTRDEERRGKEELERRYSAERQSAMNNRSAPRWPQAIEKCARCIVCGLDCI